MQICQVSLLLVVLPVVVGRKCWLNVKSPYVKSRDKYVSRQSTCSYKCWSGWYSTHVDSGYYTKSYELDYTTESKFGCCEGYFDYGGDCYPVCRDGCPNGRCTGPDQCTCNEGFAKVGNECRPQCDDCTNGRCVAPKVCECNEGFRKNSQGKCVTSCKDPCIGGVCDVAGNCACPKDQYFNPKLLEFGVRNGTICTGKCDKPCENGFCVGRNRCECQQGYQLSKEHYFVCKAVCDPSYIDCTNGSCSAPNTCVCKPGFRLDTNKCIPICDPECINGICESPGQCVCSEGFDRSSGNECIPFCDPPCRNGRCVDPNTCECYNGYQQSDQKSYTCHPQCSNCHNGNCVAPEVCVCLQGYEMSLAGLCVPSCKDVCIGGHCNDDHECVCAEDQFSKPLLVESGVQNGTICTGKCDKPCQNGNCIGRNRCGCLHGYQPSGVDPFSCVSVCDPNYIDCSNGVCTAPNTCVCKPGFRLDTNKCIPMCDPACINGICENPGQCRCFDGYVESDNECIPVCDPSCINGKCVDPNICECYHGFAGNRCDPVCDAAYAVCGNGTCVAPNRCRCNDGYVFEEYRCVPICTPACVNGVCSSPNGCSCNDGFTIREGTNECIPTCDPPCESGDCVAPNTCRCHRGFEMRSNRCSPYCDAQYVDTLNGRCIASNVLQCEEGFSLEYSSGLIRCSPSCDPACVNAQCLSNGSCQCYRGFVKSSEDSNVCEPSCDPPCVNASCISPDQCQCWEGFGGTECDPICDSKTVDCTFGSCVDVNVCSCFSGYEIASNEGNVQYCQPICATPCVNGFCSSPDVCECHTGYNRTDSDKECVPVCEESCENATCTAPDVCSCMKGFVPLNSTVCTPFCDPDVVDCTFGECVLPDECRCQERYELVDNGTMLRCSPVCEDLPEAGKYRCLEGYLEGNSSCEPICEHACGNGSCIEPELCQCWEGFQLDELSEQCLSICEAECEVLSGTCEENVCVCAEGYDNLETVYRCDAVCDNCSNGFCETPGNCTCLEGYEMFNETLLCEPVCENCTNGVCIALGDCRCNEGFELKDQQCTLIEAMLSNFLPDEQWLWWILGVCGVCLTSLLFSAIKWKQGVTSESEKDDAFLNETYEL